MQIQKQKYITLDFNIIWYLDI